MMRKNILIIGETGFIGLNLSKFLLTQKNYNVYSLKKVDLTNKNSINYYCSKLKQNTTIIFLAAVKKQYGDSYEIYQKNTKIYENFKKIIEKSKVVKKIIFISSTSVYGEDNNLENIIEEDKTYCNSYYGLSKFFGERIIADTSMKKNIILNILRFPLIYGNDDSSSSYGPTGFIKNAYLDKQVYLWGDGTEKREFVYIIDAAKIITKSINHKKNYIVNVVSGKPSNFLEIINNIKLVNKYFRVKIKKRTKKKSDHTFNPKLFYKIYGNKFKFTSLSKAIKIMREKYEK